MWAVCMRYIIRFRIAPKTLLKPVGRLRVPKKLWSYADFYSFILCVYYNIPNNWYLIDIKEIYDDNSLHTSIVLASRHNYGLPDDLITSIELLEYLRSLSNSILLVFALFFIWSSLLSFFIWVHIIIYAKKNDHGQKHTYLNEQEAGLKKDHFWVAVRAKPRIV